MSALEDIVKRGSGDADGNIDPRMLGYKTSIFPDVSAILIIKDVEQFHHRARHIDRRLRKRLASKGIAFDYSLAAFPSLQGKMLDKLTTTTSKAEYRMENKGKPDKGLMSMLNNNQ
jgi:hypothetical protein